MDFYVEQDRARRKTRWLVFLFILCVIGVVGVLNGVLYLALNFVGAESATGGGRVSLAEAGVDFWTLGGPLSVVSALIIFGGSLFKSVQLREGGGVVARDLGGRLVTPHTTDHLEKRLLNVVEEMAVASGIPAPQVYLMDGEEGINAFAAGTEPSNAVIGMTRGALTRLTREELQGVVAHEFGHILNGDMRMNMRLIGLVFGLVVVTMLGRGMLRSLYYVRGGRSKEGNGVIMVLLAMGVVTWLVGMVGAFFGRMLQAAISRQREYLADASAVQFTRNPSGLSGALKKIGGMTSKLSHPKAVEAGHLFFSDGGIFGYGMATHPPLASRIQALEASWDGEYKESRLPRIQERGAKRNSGKKTARAEARERVSSLAGESAAVVHGGEDYAEHVGDSERLQLARGQIIRESLGADCLEAVHGQESAQALVLGLLLAQDHVLKDEERVFLEKTLGEEAEAMALQWQERLSEAHSAEKLALIDLAIPTLRGLSYGEYRRFIEVSEWLIASDQKVDLFEFMLQRVLSRHLASHFERNGFPKIKYRKIEQLRDEVHFIVSTMASVGGGSSAYSSAMVEMRGWELPYIPIERVDMQSLGRALEHFEVATPLLKKQLLRMCGLAAAHDGALTNEECELLRAIGDSIGCGVPPFVNELEKVAVVK